MNSILKSGKWIFLSGFSIYVLLHFTLADKGASMVPPYFPAPYFWNYFTGVLVLAFMVSGVIGKWDKLAAVLMAIYIFLMMVLIHIPNSANGDPMEFVNVFRNIIMIGAVLMYAGAFTKDKSFIG